LRPAVWAPHPDVVELVVADGSHPMEDRPLGWWQARIDVPAGAAYRFRLDGTDLPDPRSRWQPEGVHGPSRAVDPAAFAWHDGGWHTPDLADAVLYELHVGTFSPEGTFEGAIGRLDHVLDLGATAIELMPVAEFAGDRGWGYDGVDLFAPHHAYGGPEGLQRLVDACHARGLAVVLDAVYNHLGPEGNYLAPFGPYFSERHRTAWGPAVNFDGPGSPGVRDFVAENAIAWLRDYHLDGLRLDAVHAIVDDSPQHVLAELRERVAREVGPDRWLIAETDRLDPRLTGRYGLHAQWCDDVHHALHALLTGERGGYYADFGSADVLARALRTGHVREPYSDEPAPADGRRFVTYVQNHDQVGNRARGDRLTDVVPAGRARMAAALVLLGPFVPLLFMGEEWAASTPFPFFSSHTDPEVARATTAGRVSDFAHFGWQAEDVPDPQDPATFALARLRWDEREIRTHAAMLEWYRSLLRLRRAHPELGAGPLASLACEAGDGWLEVDRGPFEIVCAWGPGGRRKPLEGDLVLASSPDVRVAGGEVVLPPDSVAVVRRAVAEP
jgi:maltooligosyltrehalose trehalohydrolase